MSQKSRLSFPNGMVFLTVKFEGTQSLIFHLYLGSQSQYFLNGKVKLGSIES